MAATRGTGPIARAVAVLVFAACVVAILRVGQAPQAAKPAAPEAGCVEEKQAEIDRLKAEGKLSAEQAMIRRQKIAAECG